MSFRKTSKTGERKYIMKMYELMPDNGRKSFYGKAKVIVDDTGNETLYSYDIPIIKRDINGKLTKLWSGWSNTTGAHIKAFCGLDKKAYVNL